MDVDKYRKTKTDVFVSLFCQLVFDLCAYKVRLVKANVLMLT